LKLRWLLIEKGCTYAALISIFFQRIILLEKFMPTLTEIASQIGRDVVRMVYKANSGHPGSSLGCAHFLTALHFQIMKFHPKSFDINRYEEDLFFLSNGHISQVLYATLARARYFDVNELATFRKINSRLQGHPTTHEELPGIRGSKWFVRTRYECSYWSSFGKETQQRSAYSLFFAWR